MAVLAHPKAAMAAMAERAQGPMQLVGMVAMVVPERQREEMEAMVVMAPVRVQMGAMVVMAEKQRTRTALAEMGGMVVMHSPGPRMVLAVMGGMEVMRRKFQVREASSESGRAVAESWVRMEEGQTPGSRRRFRYGSRRTL